MKNIILIGLLLVVALVPDVKAAFLSGLVKIGLFKPDTEAIDEALLGGKQQISFKDGKGENLTLAELKGKVVFLNFWATWCPPCKAEMPSINSLYKKFAENKDIVFIMVDADGNYAKAKKFIDRKKYSFPVYTMAGEIPRQLFAGTLPTTVIINKSGKISFRHEGLADYAHESFIQFIQAQLKQ
jgi:thiol-disulfide isomerase/thioredoxin